ncbi:MAG TPA: deoxyribodipyrimidine photo-lyase [Methanothrix sp.]|nr:deoxyribodipyrimidine photo-lyase [Methanothrix sp.]
MLMPVNPLRVRTLLDAAGKKGPVIYWMSRDQRVHDNWALLYAQELAKSRNAPMAVAFCLAPRFLDARAPQYHFMLDGLRELESSLLALNIPFLMLSGDPGREVARLAGECGAGALVTDFSPLRQGRQWRSRAAKELAGSGNHIPFYEVDAHNILPCWNASPKQEWAAYSFRPKVRRLLPAFLEEFPLPAKMPESSLLAFDFDPAGGGPDEESITKITGTQSAPLAALPPCGEHAATSVLKDFLISGLAGYATRRNDPNLDGQSGLSPYLHFGQISAQRIALEALKSEIDAGAFLEELIVRRELAENFCFYNAGYDEVGAYPDWAKKSLAEHQSDSREYIYTRQELEEGRTHDELWNAAERQMLLSGRMHGYLRMYWAKKILEWTASPAMALQYAIYLNDSHELDGRDPNGYAGIAWSQGGLHDRAWKERAIFGKVRYMSYNGAKGKFDIQAYIDRWS